MVACGPDLGAACAGAEDGAADVVGALYIAAFIASRYDPMMKAFRTRLQAAGKAVKLALTARARKLLTILNAMMKSGQNYVKQNG